MPLFRKVQPHALAIAMTGVKMGDRLLQVGCADRKLLGALAAKVGLTGRAAVVVERQVDAARAREAAAQAGVFIELDIAPFRGLPYVADAFDLAVVDGIGGLLASRGPEDRAGCLREIARVLRAGGRLIVIERAGRGGLGALVSRGSANRHYASGGAAGALEAEGFRSVRTLAERERLRFTEGIKPR